MHPMFAAATAAALVAISATPAAAQVDSRPMAGPPAPSVPPSVRTGPLPTVLTLAQALEEAQARSPVLAAARARSEEHTSELQSLMRISYAVFCLKKQKQNKINLLQH